ncbi:hypothetical protein OW763_14040 [Clostridium aestuarii]|uniref:DUF5683 domain-containing protein n=1 Tax=Clostridium aestuarii TaxID=338193 RepID=A0ABT4D5H4_9CLOT|nr:hypothetical protein [Clostridium aestuarii]MCY6485450.1 hypothetical protein [Clostridium aestuarii]
MNRRSRFLTFVTACIPGIGYMYLGLMKKGIQACVIFFLLEDILSIIGLGGIGNLIQFILWFYLFFDTYNIAHRMDNGEIVMDSDFFFEKYMSNNSNAVNNSSEFDSMNFKKKQPIQLDKKNMTIIAYIIITLGVLGIVNKFFAGSYVYYQIKEGITQYFIPVMLIIGGLFMLRKKEH